MGVRTVRIRETWRHPTTKGVLKFTVPKATHTCQDDQIFDRLNVVIYGAMHGVQAIWDNNLTQKTLSTISITLE